MKDAILDENKNVYLTGRHTGTVDFDPGTGVYNLPTGTNTYILSLDSLGDFLWAESFESNGVGTSQGNSIHFDITENLLCTGYFTGTVDFDPQGTFNMTSLGNTKDAYVVKLYQCLSNTGTETVTSCGPYFWPVTGQTYSVSNTTIGIATNVNGCDSVITLNLIINDVNTNVTQTDLLL